MEEFNWLSASIAPKGVIEAANKSESLQKLQAHVISSNRVSGVLRQSDSIDNAKRISVVIAGYFTLTKIDKNKLAMVLSGNDTLLAKEILKISSIELARVCKEVIQWGSEKLESGAICRKNVMNCFEHIQTQYGGKGEINNQNFLGTGLSSDPAVIRRNSDGHNAMFF